MSVAQIGQPGVTLVSTGTEFDPNYGWVYIYTFVGNRADVAGAKAAWVKARARVADEQEGPVWKLTVRTSAPQGGQNEEVNDKWTFNDELPQISIWASPKVIESIAPISSAASMSVDDMITHWKKLIKDKQDTDTDPTASGFREPLAGIYAMITRGQEFYEGSRPVLTRTRTFSASYAGGVSMDAVPKIYTTAKLISTFKVDAAIAKRLPADPAYTPPYTTWAWKQRQNTSEFVLAIDKVQEVADWTFAAWSTLTYDLIS